MKEDTKISSRKLQKFELTTVAEERLHLAMRFKPEAAAAEEAEAATAAETARRP